MEQPQKPKTGCPEHSNLSNITSTTCTITTTDGSNSISARGRCDDRSDDSIASSGLAEASVIKAIGVMI